MARRIKPAIVGRARFVDMPLGGRAGMCLLRSYDKRSGEEEGDNSKIVVVVI